MSYFMRALCYISRKKVKTLLLFLVLFLANMMLLGTMSVSYATESINKQILEKTNSKIVAECKNSMQPINKKDVEMVVSTENIAQVNCVSEMEVFPSDFIAIVGSAENNGEDNQMVCIHGYDEITKDSPFDNMVSRITEGEYIRNANEVIIHKSLAEANAFEISDQIHFKGSAEKIVSGKIVGFYMNGNESNQTNAVTAVNRIENQIYVSNTLAKQLSDEIGYEKVIGYVENPERIKQTEANIRKMLGDKAEIAYTDQMFQNIKLSIQQIERVSYLIFLLTLLTSIIIIGLLLCMWMRNRKREIAVYFSIGILKREVIAQMLLEIFFIYMVVVWSAAAVGKVLFPQIGMWIKLTDIINLTITVSLANVLILWVLGQIVLFLLVGVALFPYITKSVKLIFAEREG